MQGIRLYGHRLSPLRSVSLDISLVSCAFYSRNSYRRSIGSSDPPIIWTPCSWFAISHSRLEPLIVIPMDCMEPRSPAFSTVPSPGVDSFNISMNVASGSPFYPFCCYRNGESISQGVVSMVWAEKHSVQPLPFLDPTTTMTCFSYRFGMRIWNVLRALILMHYSERI